MSMDWALNPGLFCPLNIILKLTLHIMCWFTVNTEEFPRNHEYCIYPSAYKIPPICSRRLPLGWALSLQRTKGQSLSHTHTAGKLFRPFKT